MMPDERFSKVGVQQIVSVLKMTHEETYDEADHREAFAAIEQNGDYVSDRSALHDHFVAHSFQCLQRAGTRIRSDPGSAVPEPYVPIADEARGMVEQPVQYCDAVAEVSLEERQERPAVRRRERSYTDASSTVIADPIVMGTGTVASSSR